MNSVVSATMMKMCSDWKNMSQYFWAMIMLECVWHRVPKNFNFFLKKFNIVCMFFIVLIY